MSLLSPWSLAWLGLLVPLVLLYVLRRRRTRKVVGSTLLWEAAMRDLRAERPWQRLRPHVSLLLLAAALICGALALARPAGAGHVPSGSQLAVVIDVSASMAARSQGGERRIDRALAMARSLARDLPQGGAMMVVAAARQPEVLTAPTADPARLEAALDRARVRGPGADLAGAVAVASDRLREAAPGSRVLVLTDAALEGNVSLSSAVPVEVRRVGGEAVNDAILALDVRARPEPGRPDRAEIFTRVARFGGGPGEVRITASTEDGTLLSSRRVTLAPGQPQGVLTTADLPPRPPTSRSADRSFVRVRLEPLDSAAGSAAQGDALSLDDLAVAPSPAERRLPVVLVGDASAPVRRVLSTDPEVELYATDLSALARHRRDGGAEPEGLYVYAGATPEQPPPGDSVVVAPRGEEVFGVPLGPVAEQPAVVSWAEEDPRLRFVRFSGVELGPVRPLASPAVRPLLTTDGGLAMGVLPRPDGEVTLISVDPARGDWASRPGFVVFFRNLLERARARRAEGGIAPGELGAPLRVPAPDGATVRVRAPDGRRIDAPSRGGIAVVDVPAIPGVFAAEVGDQTLFALRNLTDAEESDLSERATFVASDGRTAVPTAAPVEHAEAWPWLVAALLGLLALELLWSTREGAHG